MFRCNSHFLLADYIDHAGGYRQVYFLPSASLLIGARNVRTRREGNETKCVNEKRQVCVCACLYYETKIGLW